MCYGSRDHVYWYDANNRLTNVLNGPGGPSIIGLGYDVRGNVINKNGNLFVFDHGNRLRTAQGTDTYRYDAQGRRVRTAGSDGLLYEVYNLGGQLLWQRDEQIGMRYEHIYLNGSVVAIRRRPIGAETEDVFYWHNDALGSQIAATQGATVAQTTEHEPYGRMLNRANNNRIGYTGHVMDQATGLIYMQQRYYDPLIPRFLSVDPVTAYDSGDMRLFNRYAYAFNNPYKFTDPDGRCPFCNALNLKNQLVNAAEWISDKANAVSEKLDKVDVRLEAGVALGPGIESSVSLLHGDGQIGFIPVGEGADINISLQPKKGFEVSFANKPVDAPIQFSGALEASGGAILHGGAEVNFNPGGTAEVVPKVGVGAGELVKYSPTIKFIEWKPLGEKIK